MGKVDPRRASIIFDLDGTLIDSAKDIQWVANKALSEVGVTPISYEEAVSFIGEGAPLFVKKMISARSIDSSKHDFLLEKFLKFYEGATQFSKPYDDVVTVLEISVSYTHLTLPTKRIV